MRIALTLGVALALLFTVTSSAFWNAEPAPPLQATFEAHGGLDQWQQQATLRYTLDGFPLSPQVQKSNRSVVDLRTRKNRIEGEEFTVGFDGESAWSLPTPDAAGLPTRFFNLGSFYFIGIPFVFADPGVNVEYTGDADFQGKSYRTYRVTFGATVGHTAEDDYVAYVDPETDRLRLIHHSVTELSPDLRVVWAYDEYQSVNGLLVVKKLTYYPEWNDGEIAAEGAVTIVRDVELSTTAPDPQLYAAPTGANISQ